MKEHFAGFGDEEDAIVFAVGKVFGADGTRVAVAEVDPFASGLGNLGGEGDLGAAFFDAIFKCPQAANMR